MTKKISTKDWRNLPTEKWNTTTVHAFLIDETKRRFDAEYIPGGGGPKSKRWSAEKGMIKRELDRRGAEVVRKFIEICWREYYTPNPDKYPFPSFGFCLGYMDRNWTEAEREVKKAEERAEIAERSDSTQIDEEWF